MYSSSFKIKKDGQLQSSIPLTNILLLKLSINSRGIDIKEETTIKYFLDFCDESNKNQMKIQGWRMSDQCYK